MRINEYNSLEEFVYEYATGRLPSSEDKNHIQHFMGIEFKFHNKYYRMCREPGEEDEMPKLANGLTGRYEVSLMHCEKLGYPVAELFESEGWFSDLNDVLENCFLDGVNFKTAIMDDSTEILSKD